VDAVRRVDGWSRMSITIYYSTWINRAF